MEDYSHYEATLDVLNELREHYDNVGTVIQSYLYRAEEDLSRLKDMRIRLVKGAYKESEEVAFRISRILTVILLNWPNSACWATRLHPLRPMTTILSMN